MWLRIPGKVSALIHDTFKAVRPGSVSLKVTAKASGRAVEKHVDTAAAAIKSEQVENERTRSEPHFRILCIVGIHNCCFAIGNTPVFFNL